MQQRFRPLQLQDQRIDNPEVLGLQLADRHTGIGGDGVVLICSSEVADAKMRMFNLDGNAICYVGKYLYGKKLVEIETLSCGIGACAAVVAVVENGFWQKNEEITVRLKCGSLVIRYTDDTVFLRGDASIAYEGVVQL